LRGLPKDLAEVVAGHLVTAGLLIEEDPELAYRHAEAARRRAARLPVVREAAAETAYAAGHWDVALSEFRALRRMTGTDDYLPVMADCERALGRPQAALKIAKEARRKPLEPALAVEMLIVEAGARNDLGQQPEARRVLHQAILDLDDRRARQLGVAAARLYYAYADALENTGKPSEARQWFDRAARLDAEGETDADERRDLLDGMLITFDDSDPEGEDPADTSTDDADDRDAGGRRPGESRR
jgi:tetratricopeptide (TPR) repeat protein